jgi:hypothetical protein
MYIATLVNVTDPDAKFLEPVTTTRPRRPVCCPKR